MRNALSLLFATLSLPFLAPLVLVPPAFADPLTANGWVSEDFIGCTVFWDIEANVYKLDDYGGFGEGDWVTVTGEWEEACASGCEYVYDCVQVSSIVAWPPDFAGCGELFETEHCQYFRAGSGPVYQLSDYGGFPSGAEVYVVGHRTHDYITFCMEGVEEAAIMDNRIVPCAESAVEDPGPRPSRWGAVKRLFR